MPSYVHRGRRPQGPRTVYGVSRETSAAEGMARQSAWFAAHNHDTPAEE
jgi:hypothetical protein